MAIPIIIKTLTNSTPILSIIGTAPAVIRIMWPLGLGST